MCMYMSISFISRSILVKLLLFFSFILIYTHLNIVVDCVLFFYANVSSFSSSNVQGMYTIVVDFEILERESLFFVFIMDIIIILEN